MPINTDKLRLYAATSSDIDTLIELRILFADELAGKTDVQSENATRASLRDYFETELNHTCLCWLATVNGQPASTVSMVLRRQPSSRRNLSGRWGYLMNVFTLPAYRRQGLSSMLLGKITEHAATLGITAFELHATEVGAQVYEKNGFTIHPEPTYRLFL